MAIPAGVVKSNSTSSAATDASQSVCLASAGGSHTLFATANHRIYSVGRLDCGRCGLGKVGSGAAEDRVCIPQDITEHFCQYKNDEKLHMKVLQVCAGGSHSAVLVEFSDEEIA